MFRSGLVVCAALLVSACSGSVPPPATPTPSPRPGYPPAATNPLPEGTLLVQRTPTSDPPVLAVHTDGSIQPLDWNHVISVSPDASTAVLTLSGPRMEPREFAILSSRASVRIAPADWGFTEGMGWPFPVWSGTGEEFAYPLNNAIRTVRVSDGRSGVVGGPGSDYYFPQGWTASSELLIAGGDRLFISGDGLREVLYPEPGVAFEMSLSPDGRLLALILGRYEDVNRATGLWVLDTGTGAWTLAKDLGAATWEPGRQARINWSPDNRRIAYYTTSTGDDAVRSGLTIIEVKSGEESRIHDRGEWASAWSPDGRYLAYSYAEGSRQETPDVLGIARKDGRSREKALVLRGMAWGANGRLVVKRPGGLSIVNPDTMEETEIVTENGDPPNVLGFEQWVWSPSRRYIAAATEGGRYIASSLYIIDTEEAVARLFYVRAGFSPLAWLKE